MFVPRFLVCSELHAVRMMVPPPAAGAYLPPVRAAAHAHVQNNAPYYGVGVHSLENLRCTLHTGSESVRQGMGSGFVPRYLSRDG